MQVLIRLALPLDTGQRHGDIYLNCLSMKNNSHFMFPLLVERGEEKKKGLSKCATLRIKTTNNFLV